MCDMHFSPGEDVVFEFDGKECAGIVDVHQRMSGFVIIKTENPKVVAIRETNVKRA